MGLFDFLKKQKDNTPQANVGTSQNTQKQTLNVINNPEPITLPSMVHGKPLAYKYENVDIAVIRGQEPDYNQIKTYMPITFVPEPDNQYDTNAVIVRTNDTKIGYLYKGNRQEMTLDYLRRNDPVKAFIAKIDESKNNIKITMGFYKEQESEYDRLIRLGVPSKIFKLTGNRKAETQDNIACCSEGDSVEYEYDYDKEKYLAIACDDIGYFPKSAEKYLEEGCPSFIEDIEEDENDKYIVKVVVFLKSE